jgi:hypothetical protein
MYLPPHAVFAIAFLLVMVPKLLLAYRTNKLDLELDLMGEDEKLAG